MIISWITNKGANMGKLDDAFEQKLLDFCINHSVKPLNEQELKQYIPIRFVEQKTIQSSGSSVTPVTLSDTPKKHWWNK